MSINKQIEKVRSLPVERGEDWVMERRTVNIQVEELGVDMRPDILVCVSPERGIVVGANVIGEDASESNVLSWALECMLSPMAGEPRRPASVMLAGGRLKHLQETFEKLDVSVKATSFPNPIVDEVVSALQQGIDEPGVPPYLVETDVDPKVVAEFFQAAADFYKAKPWKLFEFEVPIKIEIKRKKQTDYWGVVMGSGGEEFGLSLYRSADELMDILDYEDEEEALLTAQKTWSFGFSYDEVEDIGQEAEDELIRNKWTVSGPSAYPSAIVIDPEGQEFARRPTTKELVDMTVILRALIEFFKDNKKKIKDETIIEGDVREVEVSGEKTKVVISLPAPEFLEDEDELELDL